jgi:anti-sigma factor RsiW
MQSRPAGGSSSPTKRRQTKEETMTKRNPRSKRAASPRLLRTPLLLALSAPALLAPAAYASTAPCKRDTALEQGQRDDVRAGALFLSGSLTAGEVAAPSVGSPGTNGFIMKDTIIVRTSGG